MSDVEQPQNTAPKSQPGRELKKIREQAGITLGFISEQTLIPEVRLQALENDDYESVGSAAYVTGYARAYAKVVGFDASKHIDALEDAIGFERQRAAISSDISVVQPKRKGMLLMMALVALALVVGLIGLSVALFSSESKSEQNPLEVLNEINPQRESLTPSDIAPTTSLPTVTRERSPEPVVSAREVAVEPTPSAVSPTATIELSNEDVISAAGSELQNVATKELVMNFTDECWFRVLDAEGKQLIDSIKQAGDRVVVEGVAPFNIKLGNARAVAILFEGEPVTVTPRPGRRTLELSVGQ